MNVDLPPERERYVRNQALPLTPPKGEGKFLSWLRCKPVPLQVELATNKAASGRRPPKVCRLASMLV